MTGDDETIRKGLPASTGGLGPTAAAAPPPDPGGAAGQAKTGGDWRQAVQAELGKQAKAARSRRGKYTPKSKRPVKPQAGMNRRMPPQPPGASP